MDGKKVGRLRAEVDVARWRDEPKWRCNERVKRFFERRHLSFRIVKDELGIGMTRK